MDQTVIKLPRGVPPAESFPNARLAECTGTVLEQYGSIIQQYGPALGFKPLRQLIAAEVNALPEQVLLGQGSLQLIDLAARLLIQPGDLVYVESPTYDRTLTTLRRAGGAPVGFALGADGPDPDEMARRLHNGERPRFAYFIPDFQNPSGTVMSAEKRRAIVALAEKYGFWIFEDAPYRTLRYRGQALPSLHDLLPERVCLMSSYSKTICPGVRVGYMVLPQPLAKPMAKMAEDTYINASFLTQAVVFDYIRRGWLESHLVELKQLYRQRLDAMLERLEQRFTGRATCTSPEGGFFIGMKLNNLRSLPELLSAAAKAGLELTDGRGFFTAGGDNFIRLPFCGLTPGEIRQGIDRLDGVVSALG